jgi:hypothetical protein
MNRYDMAEWRSEYDYNGDRLNVEFRSDAVLFDMCDDTPLLKIDDVKALIAKLQEWVADGNEQPIQDSTPIESAATALADLPDRRQNYTNSVYLTIPDNDVYGDYMVIDVGHSDEILIAVHEGDVKSEILIDQHHVPMIINTLSVWYENTREQD